MSLHRNLLLCTLLSAAAEAQTSGVVYTQSNDTTGNAVIALDRQSSGVLTVQGTYSTLGLGSGMGLGSQGSVTLTQDGRHLLVVNAGSNSISVFLVSPQGPQLVDVEPSNGLLPTSVAERGQRVYVLNAGGSGNVSGFTLTQDGVLLPTSAAPMALSGSATAPAQVGIRPDGTQVIVTERATNLIGLYPIGADGSLGLATFMTSSGMTPFGFEFARGGNLIVSEAFGGAPNASAVSSYKLEPAGALTPVSASIATTETAACWIANTRDGRYSFTTNTGSGTVTGYRVAPASGALEILQADGVSGDLGVGTNPLDLAITRDGQYMYVLSPATQELANFRIEANGDLTKLPSYIGLPSTSFGLAAR